MSDPLPNGWQVRTVEEVVGPKVRQAEPGDRSVPYVDIGSIDRERKRIGDTQLVDRRTAPTRARQWIQQGDVLVSLTRPNLNAVALVPPPLDGAVASTGFDVLRPQDVAPRWLFARVQTREFVEDVCRGLQGVVYPAIRPKDVRRHQLPVPSREVQEVILDALDTHLSRLDAATATLERSRRNLKRYRASVLKAAVEGRLVPTEAALARAEGREYEPASVLLERILSERRARWQASGKKGKYKEPAAPDTRDLPELPEGWCWATVEQVCSGERPSAYGVLVPGPDTPDGVPFVRVGDIRGGVVHLDDLKHVTEAVSAKFPRTVLEGGEVLLTLVGTIGRAGIAPPALRGANVARAVGVLPLEPGMNAEWVLAWLSGPAQVQQLDSASHEVARKTLNLEDVRRFTIALPPLTEQSRVCGALSRLLTIASAAEATIEANLARIRGLRSAILSAAFRGELV